MPSAAYRRKLRCGSVALYIAPPAFLNTISGESEFVKVQNYFYSVIDMITQHLDFTNSIPILQNIIKSIKSKIEYYKILDIIEEQLISVVGNISESITPGIILRRIEYIRCFIDQLPPDSEELGPVSIMMLELIDVFIGNLDFGIINKRITELQTFIEKKYGKMEQYLLIQENLLSVICNIGEGTTSEIVTRRMEYIRCLITKL